MEALILNKIKFDYELATNPKSKRFTDYHDIYKCVIKYNGKQCSFKYQTNTHANGEPKLAEVLECLVSDMGFYETSKDIFDFACKLGYDYDNPDCKKAYEGCKRTSEALHRIFTDDELGMIDDDLFYRS